MQQVRGTGEITWWTAMEALMPAPLRVLPCWYSRRTLGPMPCTMPAPGQAPSHLHACVIAMLHRAHHQSTEW